jgi:hypothetical protein
MIDPPGFALENFDPSGRWRERYLAVEAGARKGGIPVDAADTLAARGAFAGFAEFRRLLASRPDLLAQSVAGHLLVYGTGGTLSAADRQALDGIVARASRAGYGLASIVREVVVSPPFLNK